MFYRVRAFLLVLAGAILGSCTKPDPTSRVAVLRFENLTGDPTLEWLARASSEEIAGQLEGTRHHAILSFDALHRPDDLRALSAPGISSERDAAIAGGANHTVEGYITLSGGEVILTAIERNIESHRARSAIIARGPLDDLLHLTDQIAKKIDIEANPPITTSARALRSYALGLESPPDGAAAYFEEATRLDPNFGAPYVALSRQALERKDSRSFETILRTVRSRSGIRALDRAVLNLEDARLRGLPAPRIDALAAIVRAAPADPYRLRELADTELASNRAVEAADHYRRLSPLIPSDPEPLNGLTYALLFTGDEAGAGTALASYRKLEKGPRAQDTAADVHFFFGRFAEAENGYLAAYEADPNLEGGSELLKAAWTRLMRKDAKGATDLLQKYRRERQAAADPLADYRSAQFLRAMGKKAEAEGLLSPYITRGSGESASAAALQLAWWRYLDGSGPAPGKDSDRDRALILYHEQDFQRAYAIWRKLAETSSPFDWWNRVVYAQVLAKTGQIQESARYRRFNPIPQPNRALSFDDLWFPWIFSTAS